MHSVAARIALLAYLVGGMAVPAMHRHDSSGSRGGMAASAHACCAHEGHADSHSAVAPLDAPRRVAATVADASSDRAATCSDNCIVCIFAGSPQSGTPEGALAFSASPVMHITAGHVGPGFEASDDEHNRLRGPPVSMILG